LLRAVSIHGPQSVGKTATALQRVASVAIVVKLSDRAEDADVKHLRWLADKIGDDLIDAVVVTTGEQAYRRRDGIAVVPASLLGP
jgi:predicted AAA+ superfamily ATPase